MSDRLKPFDSEVIRAILEIVGPSEEEEPIIKTLHSQLKKHFWENKQERYSNTKISQSILRLIKADILKEEDRRGRHATFRFFKTKLQENEIQLEEGNDFSLLLKRVETKLIEKRKELEEKNSEKLKLESEISLLKTEVENLGFAFENAVSSLEELRKVLL